MQLNHFFNYTTMKTKIYSICKRVIPVALCIFLLSVSVTQAQEKVELSSAEKIVLPSTVLNEDRTITIYLPKDYQTSKLSYPVLYLLDGPTHLYHASAAMNFLAGQLSIPGLIIVSIHNIDRNRDFSPVHTDQVATSGGAEKFLTFLSDELTGYMKEHYRISDFSILLGHSFGGTFIGYTLAEKPELFDGYIAVSPYMQYADNYVIGLTKEKLSDRFDSHKYLYMTVGNEPNYFDPLDEYTSVLKEKMNGTLDFKYVKMEDENHASNPYISLFNGLRFIFSDWPLPREEFIKGLEVVDTHYKKISDKYGLEVQAPENLINNLGY